MLAKESYVAAQSELPRLERIVPEQVAAQIVANAVDQLRRQGLQLGFGELQPNTDPNYPLMTPLGRSVAGLGHFAKVGKAITPAEAQRALVEVYGALRPSQAYPEAPQETGDLLDPTTEIGVLLMAARARVRLVGGAAVSVAELAALASLNPSRIRQLITEGELARDSRSGLVTHRSAYKWLAYRRVPGFSRPMSGDEVLVGHRQYVIDAVQDGKVLLHGIRGGLEWIDEATLHPIGRGRWAVVQD